MRVLVIGGTRFIGRHTVTELLRRGHEVTLFHRGRTPNPFGDRVTELLGDRLDSASVHRALHGAAFDGVADIAYAWDARTGDREVSYIVDGLARPPRRYVYLSSVSVYAEDPMPLREDGPRDPALGAYSEDKIAAEDYLFAQQKSGRLDISIVRPPYVYGPWNNIPREAWFWDRIVAGRPVIVPDGGNTLFHWAAASDVAWGIAECLENPAASGQAFNVGEAAPVTHGAFIDRLAQAAGRPVEKVPLSRERIHELGGSSLGPSMYFGATLDAETDFSVSIDKARDLLGFRPTEPAVGLTETFRWYMENDRGRVPKFTFDRQALGR